jgi:uncharacterized protein YkwD
LAAKVTANLAWVWRGPVGAGGAAIAVALGFLGVWASVPSRVVEEAAQKTFEQRLDELSNSMRASAHVVQQISAELDARAAAAKRLKEEAETAEAISHDTHRRMSRNLMPSAGCWMPG